ncbi:hypothetical protein RFI_03673 [Reticulomyxa filosa]|uniref:Uncharacterized protein n=1 Tax=Reticulomyxa filosa TaxID=46433 RepID=X6P4I3_RETFI|nr:hypothetical protein RFI_03673 [Reticulomyxa filosa]|eukprot:ETO33435.1 hypothetical protein RFI_03673 [Reticulomyxa filosa]
MTRLKCFNNQILLFLLWNFHIIVVNQYFGNKIIKTTKSISNIKKKVKYQKLFKKRLSNFVTTRKTRLLTFLKKFTKSNERLKFLKKLERLTKKPT